MIFGNTLPVGTWLLGLLFHLVMFQCAYELESLEDSVLLENLGKRESLPSVIVGDEASRFVLFVVSGLRADLYNFRGNSSAFYWEVSRTLGLNGLSRPPLGASARLRLSGMLSGVDAYSDRVETVFDHSEGFYVGPPSLIPGNVRHNFTFQSEWENVTVFPFPRYLDEWVFANSEEAISRSVNTDLSKKFFLIYFSGFDVASNLKGAFSDFAIGELLFILDKVKEIFKIIENTFQDSRTSYILTSDNIFPYRPKDFGEHLPRYVPFVTWGFGFSRFPNFVSDNENYKEIKAIDIAPLTSTLLRIQIPTHSFGLVPLKCLHSRKLQADCLSQNALQLNNLYLKFEEKLSYPWARLFSPIKSSSIKDLCENIRNSINISDFHSAIITGKTVVNLSLLGIDYFVNFNNRNILMSTFISLLGWIIVTSFWVLSRVKLTPIFEMEVPPQSSASEEPVHVQAGFFQKFINYETIVDICGGIMFVIISMALLFSQFPHSVGPSFMVSFSVLWLVTRYVGRFVQLYRRLKSVRFHSSKAKFFMHLLYIVFWNVLYPYKIADSVFMLLACACSCTTDLRRKPTPYCSYWILSALPFSILLFAEESTFYQYAFLSVVSLWILSSFYLAIFLNAKCMDWIIIIIYQFFMVSLVIKSFCGIVLPSSLEWWAYWFPVGLLSLIPLFGSSKLPLRLFHISLGLSLYFSNEFEPIAYFITVIHLLSWMLIENQEGIHTFLNSTVDIQGDTKTLQWSDFRITFYYFVYLLMTFLVVDPFYDVWPKNTSTNPPGAREGPFVVFFKVFPMTLLVNVVKTALSREFCTVRIHLELLVFACVCLFNLVFIPGSHQNTCLQVLFFFSLVSEPLSVLLLRPSLLATMRKRQTDNVTVIHFEAKNEKDETNL